MLRRSEGTSSRSHITTFPATPVRRIDAAAATLDKAGNRVLDPPNFFPGVRDLAGVCEQLAGASTSGKSRGFGPRIRRFESYRPKIFRKGMIKALTIFSGNANRDLADTICKCVEVRP